MKKFTLNLLVLLLTVCLCGCTGVKRPDYESLDYQYNIESISAMFPFFQNIESVYWKSGVIGSRTPGPNSYEYKIFLIISYDEYASLSEKYEFEISSPDFVEGITPEITGCTTFEWSKNDKLSHEILGFNYVGDVYFDQINKIVYIDAESA